MLQPSTATELPAPSADGLIRGVQPPRRSGFHLAAHPLLIRVTTVGALLIAWELYGRSINPIFLSYPTAIALAAIDLLTSGELVAALLKSLQGLAIGFVLAVVVGIGLGVLMGRYRTLHLALDPFLVALYATPGVALIPLIMLWFGLGLPAKIVIIFEACFFPIVINTFAGVRNVSRANVDVARAYGASERQVMRLVVLPSALPFIMAGIRLAVGRGVIGMVVAEFFTTLSGLGSLIIVFSNAFATAKLFVPVITLSLLGVSLTALAQQLERRLAPWKETERAE
ncbi:MAG TPA: ABC transporter permease [Chloroflexota bacterium]|nr:ABC transporter permease [Chloroflexota bacterium]